MSNLRAGLGALAVTAAVTAGGIGAAAAATHPAHPVHPAHFSTNCAKEQHQVDKAQAKLDALTAKFANVKTKVKQDKRAVAATKGSERAQAKKALVFAKEKRQHVHKAKKAQVQRLAHATTRLQKCLAGVSASSTPTTTPTETASTTPTESTSTSASTSASATA